MVFVAGMIGWDESERIVSDDLVDQIRQALSNTVAVLEEAGAGPSDIARMTWFVTDRDEYLRRSKDVGHAYREVMGTHYPAMSLVIVAGLLEAGAKIEIETTAVIASG